MKYREAIVFDLGGVLVGDPYEQYFKHHVSFDEYVDFLKFINPFTLLWDLGAQGRLIKDALIISYPEKTHLITAWFSPEHQFFINPLPAIKTVKALHKKGYPLFSITNWSRDKYPQATGEQEFLTLFSDIVISHSVELIKPDRRIFELLLARNNLKAHECIFIDDREINVKAAINVGYRGVVYKNVLQLEKDLKDMGIKI